MEVTRHYATFKRYHLFVSKWFSVYLHVYYDSKVLPYHDHPWWNVSIRLWGRMVESRKTNLNSFGEQGDEVTKENERFIFRRATTGHKMRGYKGLVTLFITGPEWNVTGGRA